MRIDVGEVIEARLPRASRWIPRRMVRWLEDYICQDRLNQLLERHGHLRGADFARAVIDDLGITFDVAGTRPDPEKRRVIFASNHPLGGLDGLVLASMVKELYGGRGEMKFVVNDLLTFVEPLRDIFLGVNKHGAQSRESARAIDEAFGSDVPMLMFPAGLCSRQGPDGQVKDLEWQKMIVNKAISSERDVIPVHFSGENSRFFYKFANLRKRLGLKFNIEMLRLPREMFLNEGSHFTVTLGPPIGWQRLHGGPNAQAQANVLRETVYKLRP